MGNFVRSVTRWVAAGRAPAPNENENENDDNEKHGIPDNPPQQCTQGKNTPFGRPLTPISNMWNETNNLMGGEHCKA